MNVKKYFNKKPNRVNPISKAKLLRINFGRHSKISPKFDFHFSPKQPIIFFYKFMSIKKIKKIACDEKIHNKCCLAKINYTNFETRIILLSGIIRNKII